jgi:hypothetical protein
MKKQIARVSIDAADRCATLITLLALRAWEK